MPDYIVLKIERADHHIADMCAVLDKLQPYEIGLKADSQTGEGIVYVKAATPIPSIVPLIAGDAIQNLYSALDYLARELVIANGEKATSKTAFPITEKIPATKDEKARYAGQVHGMRQEVKDLLGSLNPYRGEDNLFWTLHKLNNINKHRTIVAINNAGAYKVEVVPGSIRSRLIKTANSSGFPRTQNFTIM